MNTLIFVDLPVSDLQAAHDFYEELFGWVINPRPAEEFHQIVPGEGLHLGLYNAQTQHPDPNGTSPPPRSTLEPRTYILVDAPPATYLDKAVALGATELWRDQWWEEFQGHHASFRDPWGNQIVMWWKGEDNDASAT